MALNGDILGTAMATSILALTDEEKLDVEKIWKTIGNEIVSHIKNNGEISVSVSTTHSAGVIAVVGTATAQSNPLPIASTSGSGKGNIT